MDLCTDEDIRKLLIQFLNNAPPTTPSNVNGSKRDDKSPHPLFVSQTPPSHNISRRRPRRQVNSFVITPSTSQVTEKKSSSESVHDDQSPGNKEVGGAVRSHPLKPVQLKLETNGENIENNENNTSNDNNNSGNGDGVLITESTTVSQPNACTDSVIHVHVSTSDQSTTVSSTLYQSTAEQHTVVQSTIEQPPMVQSNIDQSTINRPTIDQSKSIKVAMPVLVHDNNNTDDGDDNTEDEVFQVEAPAKLDPEECSPEVPSSPVDAMESMDVSLSVVQSGVGGPNTTVEPSLDSLEDQSTKDQPESQTQSPINGSQSPVTGSQSLTDSSQSPKESLTDGSHFPVDATGHKDEAVSSLIVNISIDKVHLLTSTNSNHTSPLGPPDARSGDIDTDVCSLSITSGGVSNVKDIDNSNVGDDLKKGGESIIKDKPVQDTMTLLPDDEDSISTVVSFSTSLPLVFSSRASSRSQSPAPSLSPTTADHAPFTTTPTPSTLLINTVKSGLPLRRGRSEEPPSSNYKSVNLSNGRHQLKSPPSIAVASSMVKSPPAVAENERPVGECIIVVLLPRLLSLQVHVHVHVALQCLFYKNR